MANVQITVSGTAQDVTKLIEVEHNLYVSNTVVFAANTFQLNNKYNSLFFVGPVITATAEADPESWE